MADQDTPVIFWVVAGFVILLIAVVFFIMPSQGPKPVPGNFTFVSHPLGNNANQTPANSTLANTTMIPVNETQNQSCVVIEFYGAECPHCKNMFPIVSQVENETGIKFTRLEIWYNSTNQNVFQSYSSSIQRDCGLLGVPTFTVIGANNSSVSTSRCGDMIESDLKYFVTSNCGKI
jgi:predicted bacteriocin transport accessory protein